MDKKHTFIIAEIGSNHDQDLKKAYELMDVAKEAGADAVKFQSIQIEKMIEKESMTAEMKSLYDKIQLREDWYQDIFSYAKKINIECLSAPTYLDAIPLLQKSGANYMKIASPQVYGFPRMIRCVAQTGLKTIMSTGYCEEPEIERAVRMYEKYGDKRNLTLLHCVSQYPTEPENVNLKYMVYLKDKMGVDIGLSDHTMGTAISIAAVSMGAKVIEKHITLSRASDGPDHFFALEPKEFSDMVLGIRSVELALGSDTKELTSFERDFRDSIVVYPYAKKNMMKGEVVEEDDIEYYRATSPGISPWLVDEMIIGKSLNKDLQKNEKFI